MSNHTTNIPLSQQQFHRQWFRVIIPSFIAIAMFGVFAYQIPSAIWIAIPILCALLMICVLFHGGLLLSQEGIEWYILNPKWRYRKIPWSAILDMKKSPFGFGPVIHLSVASGRYEPWIWGNPQQDRSLDIAIWTNGFANGETLWDSIQNHWNSQLQNNSELELTSNQT